MAPTAGQSRLSLPLWRLSSCLLAGGRPSSCAGGRATGEAWRGIKRVAVLPFENLGAPEDDYFADGIADAVRGKLTSVPGIAGDRAGQLDALQEDDEDAGQIAEELDAHYLLTATVRWQKSGGSEPGAGQSRSSSRSGRPESPTSKWQQPFDAALTDVFQVQSEIATKVAQALGVALAAGEQKQLSEKPTQNVAAYDAFLKGEEASRGMTASDPPSLRKALGFYEQAVALDPGFAQAWARVVDGQLGARTSTALRLRELAERARQAAEKAVSLAPDRPRDTWREETTKGHLPQPQPRDGATTKGAAPRAEDA